MRLLESRVGYLIQFVDNLLDYMRLECTGERLLGALSKLSLPGLYLVRVHFEAFCVCVLTWVLSGLIASEQGRNTTP